MCVSRALVGSSVRPLLGSLCCASCCHNVTPADPLPLPPPFRAPSVVRADVKSLGFSIQAYSTLAARDSPSVDDVLAAVADKNASCTAAALLTYGQASSAASEVSSSSVANLCAFPAASPAKQRRLDSAAAPMPYEIETPAHVPQQLETLMKKGTVPVFPPLRYLSFTPVPAAHALDDAKEIAKQQLRQSRELQSSLTTLFATDTALATASVSQNLWGTLPPSSAAKR